LTEMRHALKYLKTLKETKYSSYKKEQNLKEQIENDEYAILNFIRRRETV